eukprot:TRINITY_DN3442_c0_g1_i1.p1 TRINITY_DN3442_c0_g1~~TRINITY_DN3442_c0_g1_i1.p1  ORF type:complete len:139 (-),score=35.23 TRINITY_DN3442_c0_g1_i1:195-611(-)
MIIISAQHCAPPRGAPPRNERCPSLLQFNGERLEPRLQHKCVYIDVYDLLLFILRAATDVAIRASAAASRKAAVDTPCTLVSTQSTWGVNSSLTRSSGAGTNGHVGSSSEDEEEEVIDVDVNAFVLKAGFKTFTIELE